MVVDFYMDDLMSGSNGLQENQSVQQDLQVLLKLDGYYLRNGLQIIQTCNLVTQRQREKSPLLI